MVVEHLVHRRGPDRNVGMGGADRLGAGQDCDCSSYRLPAVSMLLAPNRKFWSQYPVWPPPFPTTASVAGASSFPSILLSGLR